MGYTFKISVIVAVHFCRKPETPLVGLAQLPGPHDLGVGVGTGVFLPPQLVRAMHPSGSPVVPSFPDLPTADLGQ